jgi:hypothetical protein
MITLGEKTVQRTQASWHKDPELNKRQAKLLADDVLATREKLAAQALLQRFPNVPGTAQVITKDGKEFWFVFTREGQTESEAVAVFTLPVTRIKGYRLICEWHWAPIGGDKN